MNIINGGLKFKEAQTKRTETKKIVLHHAMASKCSIQDIHAWHLANGWIGCGYHFLVRKDGSIYSGRDIDSLGAHCLNNNHDSIGICAEGNYMIENMPDIQKLKIVELIKFIESKYGDLVVGGHKEFSSSECPGKNYPLDEIKNLSKFIPTPPKHWAQDAFDSLKSKGIKINETRFNDKLSRAELFVLLNQIVK